MEYLSVSFAALAFLVGVALWFRIAGQGAAAAAATRAVDLLQRQDGVLSALQGELATTRAELRDDQARVRSELAGTLATLRTEQAEALKGLREVVELRLEAIRTDSAAAAHASREETLQSLQQYRVALLDALGEFRTSLMGNVEQSRAEQTQRLAEVTQRLETLTSSTEQRLETVRASVEGKLQEIRTDNATQLEQMRATVDEKLQTTLEQRLGESFRTVSQHLESVQRGLGEMQTLASGVGDLKKVLTNVKARGTWGEIQLGSILEQFLAPGQFECNFAARESSNERVEFAVRIPGNAFGGEDAVWVPIDSKFPQEDYARMMDACELGDAAAVEQASKGLEQAVRKCARDICDKYINPPRTTPFAILYLPTEGLFAEIVRRPGLVDELQRDYRVNIAGPTTVAAILTAFQAGFRTLAIQKRSDEVWTTLGKVKTEFGKFGDVLGKVQKKLQEAGKTIDDAHVRTRAIERSLRVVDALPLPGGQEILLAPADDDCDGEVLALAQGVDPLTN